MAKKTGVFTSDIRVVVSNLEGGTELVIKKLTLDIVANLVRSPPEGGTPVDTGWARANWIPSVGNSVDTPAGSQDSVSDAEQNQGQGQVGTYKLRAGDVYISNNVPYILKLNEGSSPQARAGFVQRAIQEAINDLRSLG